MRLRILLLSSLALAACAQAPHPGETSPLRAVDLRCEYLCQPLGIDARQPRLSWQLQSRYPRARGQGQDAYRILVAHSQEILAADRGDLWDSGVVPSSETVGIVYDGAPLGSRRICYWKVRVWDRNGLPSAWSAPTLWSMGLLEPSDWHGEWIGAADAGRSDGEPRPEPWLRRAFTLPAPAQRAHAFVASLGYHELYVNGRRVGDAVLTPSVSDLTQRVRYVTYDVTEYLKPGRNVLGLWLGTGWAGYPRFSVAAGPLARAELCVTLDDGGVDRLVTDGSWRVAPSPVSHIGGWKFGDYGGERVDARRKDDRWCAVDFDDSAWGAAVSYPVGLELVADTIEPNRRLDLLEPVAVEARGNGVYRVDMGRSFTGFTEAVVRGAPGATVRLSWAERADQDVTYAQRSELVLGSDGSGTFRNRFNYAVGRWLLIEGVDAEPSVRGWLVRSGYARGARFSCSNDLLNRIQAAVAWTFECLSLGGYVVDCAHRERWGYGGDAHATMESALDHFGLAAFYDKWLDDWRAIQGEDGNLPHTVPTYRGGGGPAWSGICVMLPWEVYRRTGDKRVLAAMYPTMQRWLQFLETKTEDGILQRYFEPSYTRDVYSFLGDWVPPGGVQRGGDQSEETRFFNNGYRLLNVETAARVADVLGRGDEAERHRNRARELAAAIHERFWDSERRVYVSGRQTYLALPLLTGLPGTELRADLMEQLVDQVEAKQGHVDTGIHGTWFLVKTLVEAGRDDLLFAMASKRDYPSWGHMLEQGATTIWEQWDGINSRLHSSFLSIGAWFVEGVGGIRPDDDAPGYRRFAVRPGVVGDLSWARCAVDTVRGTIESDWRLEEGVLTTRVVVPLNTVGVVRLPAGGAVTESGVPVTDRVAGVLKVSEVGDEVWIEVESGEYAFRCRLER